MNQILAVAIGGAFGSVMRFLMSTWVYALLGRNFPYGTLAVNVLGCLAMGFLFVLFTDRFANDTVLRAGILIGVLGGFTTFSSFSIETFILIDDGATMKAVLNMAGSLALCIGGTWIGVLLGRMA
ncbi:MAG: fluoride efflux transporter CrcB [Acidiferrobacterales bacterium]